MDKDLKFLHTQPLKNYKYILVNKHFQLVPTSTVLLVLIPFRYLRICSALTGTVPTSQDLSEEVVMNIGASRQIPCDPYP